ncbi:MAG: type II 3-dehydroquinate dehydratase [Pseudomonadota bacterium]
MPAAKPVCHILNGPNLNLLGEREPDIYGRETLADIEAACRARTDAFGWDLQFRQTNGEGELVGFVQDARAAAALIINPAAYTHTSIALRDALAAVAAVKIELHLSNVHAREPFRRNSYVSPVVHGVICGFGSKGYVLALDAARALAEARASR